ncbi:MAG: tetratricopeptide repeat protein [Bacteroidales bacterium]|jgi:hypothetical protein|nr:tetratricopeptide repeat protein [Bacteroidales bacterium]
MQIQQLISNTGALNEGTLQQLENLVNQYPYFQTGRILFLKNLQLENDERFSQELLNTSLCVADRSNLYHYIEGHPAPSEKKWQSPTTNIVDIKDRTLALIDTFLSDEGIYGGFSGTVDMMSPRNEKKDDIPLSEKMLVSYDYLSYLLSAHHKNPDKMQEMEMEEYEEEESEKFPYQELIDNFINEGESNNIRLRPQNADPDISKDPVIQKEKEKQNSFFSETLAQIYIKQKRYEKALEIIRNLYLKFPEKNIYFADQIRFLELLIANSKSI